MILDPKTISSSRIVIDSNETKQTSTPPKQINQNSNRLIFPTFEPKKNTFYIYIREIEKPNLGLSESNYEMLFGIDYFSDIQRFHHLPGTRSICTFIGFSKPQYLFEARRYSELSTASMNYFYTQQETPSQAIPKNDAFHYSYENTEISKNKSETIQDDKSKSGSDQLHSSPKERSDEDNNNNQTISIFKSNN